jgi:outer membrane protein assembly factor BamB
MGATPGRFLRSSASFLALLLGVALARPAAWPTQGQNAQRTSRSALPGPSAPSPRALWTFATNATLSLSPTVSLDGSTVFCGSWDGYLHAVSVHSGKRLWSTLLVAGARILGGATATAEGLLLVSACGGFLFALDATTGSRRWSFHAGGDMWGSPLLSLDGQAAFVGNVDAVPRSSAQLFAVNVTSGAMLWSYAPGSDVAPSAALSTDGTTVFVGSSDYGVHAVDAATGALRWRYDTGSWVMPGAAVSPVDGAVYVGNSGGTLFKLAGADGSVVWRAQLSTYIDFSPALSGDGQLVYQPDDAGILVAFNTATGQPVWNASLLPGGGTQLYSYTPLVAQSTARGGGEVLYASGLDATGSNAVLRAYDAQTGAQLWEFQADGMAGAASPTLGRGRTLFWPTYGGGRGLLIALTGA